ncbi:hypothetical protein [Halorubrum sp. DTA46]|uniref:hypothetical protein n=1 Tax=Halorubrum sp. DTA46 TaxID=3402162 RepID=UPI003AAA8411
MTDPNASGRNRDGDAKRAGDGTGDAEEGRVSAESRVRGEDRVSETSPDTTSQHASADVAPELFGW